MSTVDLTVRLDERTKKDFDNFCDNFGLNATTAVNMFIKTVVRTQSLPFNVTDVSVPEQTVMMEMKRAIKSMRERSAANGNSEMSLDDINGEIKATRMARALIK